MNIRPFVVTDTDAVIDLWTECDLVRPWNDPHKDIARKLTQDPELFLVYVADDRIQGSAMFGWDGHRGWLNYLAVTGSARGRGYATELIAHGEQLLIERGCPKLSLMVRDTNSPAIQFYERIGYTVDPVVAMGKRLIPDL